MINKEPGKALSLGEGNAYLHLIPRVQSSKGQQISIRIPREPNDALDANAQFCNAFEDGDTVIVDVILSEIPSSLKGPSSPPSWPWSTTLNDYQAAASKKSLWRYSVDTKKQTVTKTRLFDDHCFFGTVNSAVSSQKHRYIYVNIGSLGSQVAPPQGIARIDCTTGKVERWLPKNCEFCGEPMFAIRTGKQAQEDDGYILSVLYCGIRNESEILIFLANDIAAGPITRIPLGMAIPHVFFGCFTADKDAAWSADALERRAKLADKIESRGNIWNEVKSDFSGLGLRFDDMEEYFGDFFS
jgi:carotenoid cleavage dioxygenase-like enzyme